MAELPIIPKVSSILIHTGNIVNWNRLKKKLTQRPTEELVECLGSTLVNWVSTADKTQLQYETSVTCCASKFIEKLPSDSRQELKVTVKICLYKLHPESVKEVVSHVLCELDSGHIETVLLSVPEDRRSLSDIQPIWAAMEDLVEQEKIFSLGVSDLNKEQLEELYNVAKVKPIINQVNMDSCCAPPPELLAFAKENDIQLLTHTDPADMLPKERLQEVIGQSISEQDGHSWEPCWVVRYSVLLKMRGVVKTKGYIVKACRNIGSSIQ